MFSIIPREMVFYDLFEKGASNAHKGAKALLELLDNYEDVHEKVKKIKDIEHAGDDLTHEILERLNKTFITPFDREDIHELASRIDDVIDLIDVAASRMALYKIEKPTEDARLLARCLVHATAIIEETVPLLRKSKNLQTVLQRGREVHTQENEADRIEQHALASLFENSHDPRDIIKWKDVYQDLEAATDRCEDVCNVLEGIMLKNA
ncbi:MAG: DUF47 domain-containing protein [Planctomycetes bacterium]|nr:DUF47 domain-containing protein [Planctomycetota bacterium]